MGEGGAESRRRPRHGARRKTLAASWDGRNFGPGAARAAVLFSSVLQDLKLPRAPYVYLGTNIRCRISGSMRLP